MGSLNLENTLWFCAGVVATIIIFVIIHYRAYKDHDKEINDLWHEK